MAALDSMRRLGPALGQSMSGIDVPALVMHAKRDFFVSPDAALRIHERIKDSELHIFDHATHAPMFEQAPEFNRIFLRFLDLHNPHLSSAA